VTQVVIQSLNGTKVIVGTSPSGFQFKTWNFNTTSDRIVGFHGSEDTETILSIGGVTQKQNCTFERESKNGNEMIVTILLILVVVVLIIVIAVGAVIFMRRKGGHKTQVFNDGMQLTGHSKDFGKLQPTYG
jgi:hypothetical protein